MLENSIGDYIPVEGHADLPVRLANTFDPALPEPELLATADDLVRFLEEVSLPVVPVGADDVEAVREVRTAVREVFLAQSLEQVVDRLNRLLAGADAERRAEVDGGSLRMARVVRCDPCPARTIRSLAGSGLASTVERVGWDRLRLCQADPCRDMFIDTSKRGSRRFCGPRCASRTHVSRFRQRKVSASTKRDTDGPPDG